MKAPFFAALTLVCLARLLDGVQGRTLEAPPPRHPLRHRPEVSAAAAAVVAEPRRSLKALRAAGAAVKVDDDLDDGAAVPEKASTASKVESAATTTTTNRRDGSHAPAAASSGVIIRPAGPSKQYAWVGHGNFVPDHKLPIDIFHAANLVPKWLPSVDPVFAANLLYPGAVASAAASSAPALSSYASSRVVKDVKRQRDDLSPAAAGSSSSNNPFLSSVATAPNQVKPGQHRRPDPPSAKVTSSGRGDLVRLVVENDDAAAVKQAAAVVDKARKSRPRQPPSPFKGFLTATQSDGAPKSSGTFFNLPLNIEEDKFFGGLGDPFVRGVKEQGADPREVFYVFYEDPSASPAKGKAEVKAGADKKPNVTAFSKKPLLLQQHGGKQRETPSGHGQQRFPAGPELLRPQRQQPQNLQQVGGSPLVPGYVLDDVAAAATVAGTDEGSHPGGKTSNLFRPPSQDDIRTIYVPHQKAPANGGDTLLQNDFIDVDVATSFGYTDVSSRNLPAASGSQQSLASSYDSPISSYDAPINYNSNNDGSTYSSQRKRLINDPVGTTLFGDKVLLA